MPTLPESLASYVTWTMVIYVLLMFGVSFWVRGKVHSTEDFLVAGRRLPLMLAGPTLLATWFGAGTLIIAGDEIRSGGLRMTSMEPIGSGMCLLLAGFFIAGPLWKSNLLTLPDLFRQRIGPKAELWTSLTMIPIYVGWIAAQYFALGGLLNLFVGLDLEVGIILAAIVGTGYTLVGGMWSVTLTDAIQMVLILVGLVMTTFIALDRLAGASGVDGSLLAGVQTLLTQTPSKDLVLLPRERLPELMGWLSLFVAGSLGNLPGQDLGQRIFSAKSATVARQACFWAGGIYLTVGFLPGLLGLAANVLFPGLPAENTVISLASLLLSPTMLIIFVVAVLSAVLSTIDSAILAPSSVIAQNLIRPRLGEGADLLRINRYAVVGVGAASLLLALFSQKAWELLEATYELGLVALLLPLVVALRRKDDSDGEAPVLWGMAVPMVPWTGNLVADNLGMKIMPEGFPLGLFCAVLGFAIYYGMIWARSPAARLVPQGATQESAQNLNEG